MKKIIIGLSSLACFSLFSCTQSSPYHVTDAPHLTAPHTMVKGKVVSSYPIKISSNSGVGSVTGAIAGSVIGNQIGSGNGRALALIGGYLAGAFIGSQIETDINTVKAQDTQFKVGDKLYRMVLKDEKPLSKDDPLWVYKNVYGQIINVKSL